MKTLSDIPAPCYTHMKYSGHSANLYRSIFLLGISLAFWTSAQAQEVSSLPGGTPIARSITSKISRSGPEGFAWDYYLQGEYAGTTQRRLYGESQAGVQVVALDLGEFRIVEYPGGLPGDGWTGKDKRVYQGVRNGGTLKLSDPMRTISVENGAVLIRDRAGRQIGILYKVHRGSPTLGAVPPSGADVLFGEAENAVPLLDGAKLSEEGFLGVGATTKKAYRDFSLHLEFRLPYMPQARGQGRANSGVYLQRRYEVQILDSFGLEGENNECGGLYKSIRPALNMCYPPLAWQTYDIDFTSAQFDEQGKKTADARVTVRHNGVLIHDRVAIPNKTGGGQSEGPEPLPTLFQDHGNPVVYRNMWIVEEPGSAK